MKIEYFKAKLPFTQIVKGNSINEVSIARAYFENTRIDLFCFPGFSSHKLPDSCTQLREELLKAINQPISNKGEIFAIKHSNPHVEFGLLQFHQQRNNWQFKEDKIQISHLLQDPSKIGSTLSAKFKINADLESFKSLVIDLQEACCKNPQFRYRLDANQRLDLKTLLVFHSTLEKAKINDQLEYFEEPFSDFNLYKEVPTDIPYALEESLDAYLADQNTLSPRAVILKPSQQGLSKIPLLENNDIIISSCFDTTNALQATKLLASLYPEHHHGLSAKLTDSDLK